jgi:hypothetical protein
MVVDAWSSIQSGLHPLRPCLLAFLSTIILSPPLSHHHPRLTIASMLNLPIQMALSTQFDNPLPIFPFFLSWSSTWRVPTLCADLADALLAAPPNAFLDALYSVPHYTHFNSLPTLSYLPCREPSNCDFALHSTLIL